MPQTRPRKPLLIYLALIPFITAILAFALGLSPYKIYLPIWIIHSCIMSAAAWKLGASHIKSPDKDKQYIAVLSLLMVVPWVFITIFAGMGPPPSTVAGWLASETQQQIRYIILIVSGLLFAFGFNMLKELQKRKGENLYSTLGMTFMLIKLPLYILDMLYLGAYRIALFHIYAASNTDKRPDWSFPIRELFFDIGMIEVPLTWLASAAFAISLRRTNNITSTSCRIYVGISLLGFILSALPSNIPPTLFYISYLASIPAFTFIIPYFFAINLLRRL